MFSFEFQESEKLSRFVRWKSILQDELATMLKVVELIPVLAVFRKDVFFISIRFNSFNGLFFYSPSPSFMCISYVLMVSLNLVWETLNIFALICDYTQER